MTDRPAADPPSGPMTRTFVAIPLPEAWREYLGVVTRDLSSRTGGLSWVRPENLHLTVRFLGDLDDEAVGRACDSVRAGAEPLAAPVAALGRLGGFPNLERPRVVWAALAEGGDEVTDVARVVNEALRRGGFGPPEKPFRPHVTLARVREHASGLQALREAVVPPPPGPAALDRITVMKSDLHPSGSRYTALSEVRLRPPGASRTGSSPEY